MQVTDQCSLADFRQAFEGVREAARTISLELLWRKAEGGKGVKQEGRPGQLLPAPPLGPPRRPLAAAAAARPGAYCT